MSEIKVGFHNQKGGRLEEVTTHLMVSGSLDIHGKLRLHPQKGRGTTEMQVSSGDFKDILTMMDKKLVEVSISDK